MARLLTMSPKELEKKQDAIEAEIYKLTQQEGLATEGEDGIDAIIDGVADCREYLDSSPRIAWILKEPYDDKNPETGKYRGGGWSIPRDCFLKEDKWRVLTWQRVIYVMHGLKNNMHYKDMQYVRDHPEMGNVMKSIAWLNLSKMPAGTTSNGSFADNYNKYWKLILDKQIELYNPEIIVFGNTFSSWGGSDKENLTFLEPISKDDKTFINVYQSESRILLDAYHPGIRRNVEFYVDSLIDTIRKYSLRNNG